MKRGFAVAATLCAVIAGSLGAFSADSVIKQRQKLMKGVGDAAKTVGKMVKGTDPYDADVAAAAMKKINNVPDQYVKLFPEGTSNKDDPDTEASPKIWTDLKTFGEKAQKLKAASAKAADAAAQGEDAFKPAFANLTKVCKDCHESFRIEKEKK